MRSSKRKEQIAYREKSALNRQKFVEILRSHLSLTKHRDAMRYNAGTGATAYSFDFGFPIGLKAEPLAAYERPTRKVLAEFFPHCKFKIEWNTDSMGNPSVVLMILWG